MLSMRSLISTLFISYCVFYFYITRSLFYLSIVLSSSLADERVEKLDHLFSCCGMFVFFIDSSAFLVFKLLIVCVSGFLVLLLFSLSILSWMMSSTLLMNSMVFRWLAWLEETSMLESWLLTTLSLSSLCLAWASACCSCCTLSWRVGVSVLSVSCSVTSLWLLR